METGYCPNCDAEIKFATPPSEGTKVTCPNCKDELGVVGTSPIELDWYYEYEMEMDEDDF